MFFYRLEDKPMDIYRVRNELKQGKSIYDLPFRVTFYARVSTDTEEQAHSLKNQVQYYTDFIEQNPNWTFVNGYIDEGLSATSATKRESFMRMVEDGKLGKFDLIITKELSRFSRNTLDSIKYTQELLYSGVGVIFQSDNINTLDPDAELRLTIMASIAQDEVRKISERVKFGFRRSIEKGVVLGGGNIWGYKKDKGKLVIDEKEAKIVREIFEMYATQNLGIRKIAQYLSENGLKNNKGNDFSFSTIKGILINPKYKGYYCGNKTHKYDYRLNDVKYLDESEWVMYKDEENVPPIVSEELWDKANRILKKRSDKQSTENKAAYQNKYAYSGKILCAEHNVHFYRTLYRYKTGNKEIWQCKRYSERGRAGCDAPVIYTTELDEIMKDAYNTIIKDRATIINDLVKIYSSINSSSKIKEDIAKTKVEINDIIKRKDKLLDHSIEGRISDEEFTKRNRQFNLNIEGLEVRLSELYAEEEKNKGISNTVETLRQMIASELDFSEGFNNSIIDTLLDKIEVHKTENKKIVNLKVYFKVINENIAYTIIRRGKNTSVCSMQYML